MAASPSPRGLAISSRYRILRKLGSGSTGTVYLAQDSLAGRQVALKVIRTEGLHGAGLEALQQEFRAIASLRHPQIAAAHDFGYTEEGRLPFYTREYIEGVPLPPGPPDLAGQKDAGRFLRPVLDLLDALHYLHAHDILHLDIHPGNLILAADSDRGAVLIDFGLIRPGLGSRSLLLLSSRASLPPELLGAEPPGPAADIFMAGRILLHRLAGAPGGEAKLPREIPGWGASLTLALERIAQKALRPDPRQRFASALEFRAALSEAVGDRPGRLRQAEPGELALGRESEIALIEEALRRAAAGRTAVVWFSGPPGIGKSRLLTEARWRAQLRGLEVAEARFVPEAASAPELVRVLRSIDGSREAAASWLSALGKEHGGSSRERARRAAESFFAAAGPPLVLLLDDLEHADRDSRLLAEALIAGAARRRREERSGRGLAVLAASAEPPAPEVRRRDPAGARALRPLSRRAAGELLERLLRPLAAPAPLLAELSRRARGIPLRLRLIARAVREEHGHGGVVPRDWKPPRLTAPVAATLALAGRRDPVSMRLLRALAVLERAAGRDEIAAAAGVDREAAARALGRLAMDELAAVSVQGRERLFHLADPEAGEALRRGIAKAEAARARARAIRCLEGLRRPGPRHLESLARLLLASGKLQRGLEAARRAAALLRAGGRLDAAIRLLGEALRHERSRERRLRLAEEISELEGLAGDHLEGIAALEPEFRRQAGSLGGAAAVRLRRRLGVHHHRAGRPQRAVQLFEEALRLADPRRDAGELVFIHSELAELRTFRGEYDLAQAACREGLAILESGRVWAPEGFPEEMEVTLRATQGHLELRRMNLERARAEYEAALDLARSHGAASLRALLLNNLGIVHNQLENFPLAERSFRRAERLLAAAGERSALIHIACNLAVIAAKLGRGPEAREEIEKARRLLREHPGERLEFVLGLSGALVEHLLGRVDAARAAFLAALPLGRKLGDAYLVRFGEAYLAEAQIACGDLPAALRGLESALAHARRSGPPILRRMAASRLLFLSALAGLERPAERARRDLARTPRTGIRLLEAWNDLFLGLAGEGGSAGAEARRAADAAIERALEAFRRLGIPAGLRLARAGLLYRAIARKDAGRARAMLEEIDREPRSAHGVLAVIEPLAAAEAAFLLGDLDRCDRLLQEAAGSIVGLPLPEPDWRIELLRALLAERRGDRERARHHLHRSVEARDHLLRSLPASWREPFQSRPRFAALEEARARIEKRRAAESTPVAAGAYHGLVGRSAPMTAVYDAIERLRDLDLPVIIAGETGTGKELAARAIHETGPRRRGPYYSLHCASLPAELFESELFGYAAGAFTGAEEARAGLLEHLDGGTLLLDELSALSQATQAKLLQVISSGTIRPLGGLEPRSVNVRFLASSSSDPAAAARGGALRPDLYYRLRGAEIRMPPLRERREDIPALARHFIDLHGRRLERPPPALAPEALLALGRHDWPGNVRELESLIVRLLVIASPGGAVGPESIAGLIGAPERPRIFSEDVLAGRSLDDLRRQLEREYLEKLFRDTRGDIRRMAAALGVKRSNLYTWFRRVGLDVRAARRRL